MTLAQIIAERDGISRKEAVELIEDVADMVRDGEDPETILLEELGLEPDYLFQLMEYV